MADPLVRIAGLRVEFDGIPALRGVDFEIASGEAVGLVGESGCGKSVTWLAALGLLPGKARVTGSVELDGQELLGAPMAVLDRVRGGQVAMIFQDPASSLNPVHRVGRQVAEALRLHRGMDGTAARAETRRLFDQVGIPDAANRIDAYPHELSGGQNQRVMIAMALAGRPRLLVADEPTTALDVTIQAQILDLLGRLRRETGMALVLISHDLGVVEYLSHRVAVMYLGKIVEIADKAAIFANPTHPYTELLIRSAPSLDPRKRHQFKASNDDIPSATNKPSGCAFHTRCPLASEVCRTTEPQLGMRDDGRMLACHHR